jgi:hypothetical protein
MDLLIRGAGSNRRFLAVDVTRVETTPESSMKLLNDAEMAKRKKYQQRYPADVEVRGFAFDQFGQLGQDARLVVERLVNVGRLASGAHGDDLRRELLSKLGATVMFALASRYARAAAINKDVSRAAPRWINLCNGSGLPRCGGWGKSKVRAHESRWEIRGATPAAAVNIELCVFPLATRLYIEKKIGKK